MNGYVALPIRHFICALKARPQEAKTYQAAAACWLTGCRESLEVARPLVPWSAASDELFHQAELDLQAALRATEDPQLFEDEKAEALEEAVTRYYGQLFQLQALEQQRPAFSPILSIDQLIRVAFNVLQGRCPVYELQTRFPLLQAEVASWRRLGQTHQQLYPEITWPPAWEEQLQVIEGGLGALSRFLEQGLPFLLEQAIQLLGKGSADYAQLAQELQAQMAAQRRFGPHDTIEFWLRLQEHPQQDPAITLAASSRLYHEVDEALRITQQAQRAGLGIAQPDLLSGAARVHQQALDHLGKTLAAPRPPQQVAELLNPAWDRLGQLKRVVTGALADLQNRLGAAPRMLELLEMLGQAAAGLLAPWALKAELDLRLQQQQATLDKLGEFPQVPPTTAAMLAAHQQAYQRMQLFAEDEKPEHLIEGWKVLALTMPPLMTLEAQLRREISNKSKPEPELRCIRCGHLQKPQKVCARCGGSMPQYQIPTEVEYQTVVGETPEGAQVQVADHLADLVHQLNFGTTSWEIVILEIQNQLKALSEARESFEKEMVKMLGSGGEVLDTYSQFFLVRLGQLAQTLMEMAKAADSRDLVLLKGQLGTYRPLQEELLEFQKRIAAGLQITPS